jgi:uncharacterized protein YjbI with pentapeptide repeats
MKNLNSEIIKNDSYSNSDIRGINFSGQNLSHIDFSGALAGQHFLGVIASFAIITCLLLLAALMIGFGGGWFASVVTGMDGKLNNHLDPLIVFGIPSLIIILSFTWMFASKNYENGVLGAVLTFIVCTIILTLFLVNWTESWLFGVISLLLATVATFVGVIVGSIGVATWNVLFNKNLDLILAPLLLVVAAISAYVDLYLVAHQHKADLTTFGIIVCSAIVINAIWLCFYIGRTAAFYVDDRYIKIHRLSHRLASIGGTNFFGADLTDANFTGAILKSTDFRTAKMNRTCWYDAKQLECSRMDATYLEGREIRDLLLTKEASGKSFDNLDLSELNLEKANLSECSFIGANLSGTTLSNADLSKSKLVKARLYNTNLSNTCLTGAYIQDWAIATDTNFVDVQCDYVYTRLPTKGNPDAWRKPDNRNEFFKDGDFSDFITPIIKTLDLYRQPNVDPRQIASTFKTLDLYHHHGIDPSAASIALKQLASNHPNAVLEVVALEGWGKEKIKLKTMIAGDVDQSVLSEEYFEKYTEISALPYKDLQNLLTSIAEKDDRIRSLEDMVKAAIGGERFYIETQYNMKDTAQEKSIKTILLLAANPKNTKNLRLDEEARSLQKGLERSKDRDLFQLKQRWAATPTDVRQALLDIGPYVVHFSGHGVGAVSAKNGSRSIDIYSEKESKPEGLVFESEMGGSKLLSSEVLADLFSHFTDKVECVVLNACFSEVQADAIVEHIPYVIGMKKEIGDHAAIKFTTGFYDALLAGNPIEFSFSMACNSLQSMNIPEHLTPILKIKK